MVSARAAAGSGAAELPAQVLAALAVILLVARLSGALARRLGQPAVVGEIAAGIALGPSLLGLLPGDLPHVLFPTQTRPVLTAVAQLGLVLFMFLVGLESNMGLLRGRARLAAGVSLSSIALPFALGVPLALFLHGRHDAGEARNLLPFMLFLGASLSITAFPVLARILAERSMERTPLGALALASAALDDVIAWSLLAVVVAIVANQGAAAAGMVALLAALYVATLVLVVRPGLGRLAGRLAPGGTLDSQGFGLVLVVVLASAWVTDRIGIHLVFGAFALGVVFPRDDALRQAVAERVEAVSLVLLPVFFVATGLGVDLASLDGRGVAELAVILLVAVVGKVGGAALAARSAGLGPRRSLALGVLANTRGLTELVILSIGFSLGVLDAQLYAILVIMALVTTAMAGPLLDRIYPRHLVQADLAELDRAAEGEMTVIGVLPAPATGSVPDHRWGAVSLLAADLARSAGRGHVVLSRVLPPPPAGLGVAALAELARAVSEVDHACRDLSGAGVSAAPTVARAADQAAHTAEQVRRLWAGWVVASAPMWTGADLAVVTGPAAAGRDAAGAVLLVEDGPAAWEAAVRLALGRDAPLAVRTDRGRRRLHDAARRVGVRVLDEAAADAVAVVVTGPAPASKAGLPAVAPAGLGGVPVVAVYPGPDGPHELRDRVDRLLAGQPHPPPPGAPATGPPVAGTAQPPITVGVPEELR